MDNEATSPERVPARITSPVMRFLVVGDVARASEFYRDILGFEVKEEADGAEATLGPARIRFGTEDHAPEAGHAPRLPGSAVLFLQTGDIVATRSAIHTRGGIAGEIEKVNWIKMRMFEVRDPDGNVLWFGQTYHEEWDSPSRRGAQPHGLRQALPELPFDNVPAAVDYYCAVLGFHINYRRDDFGVVDRDAITVLLIARTERHRGIGSFGVYIDDADALYAELSAKGAGIQGPPVTHPWGLRNFSVLDLEGNRITFSQTFE